MKKGLMTVFVAAFAAGCGASQNGTQPLDTIEGNGVLLQVRSRGTTLPMFHHENQWYLLGEAGLKYEICIKNTKDSSVEAVVSVDGRDVVSGRVADFRRDRGYVLLPEEEACIEGFRKSLDEVAAFEFTSRGESYAAKMGDDSNVGVIGVAVFDEVPAKAPVAIAAEKKGSEGDAPPPPETAPETGAAPPAVEGAAEIAVDEDEAEGIGTSYGGAVESAAEIVRYKRSSPDEPSEVIALFYDDREGLEAAGIKIPSEVKIEKRPTPNPFPGAPADLEFAAPPPGE
jgi:hypothetical protein